MVFAIDSSSHSTDSAQMSPAWMMASTSANASNTASGTLPCVSEMIPSFGICYFSFKRFSMAAFMVFRTLMRAYFLSSDST